MNEVQRHNGSFVVRIWWEPSGEAALGTQVWRGWAQHVRNGRQIYFMSFEALLDFIERESGAGGDQTPQTPVGLV